MTVRFQRLIIILVSLIFFTGAILLILLNSKKNLIFFYTPTELLNSQYEINNKIRIGGIIKDNSLKKDVNNNIYNFVISDDLNSIKVEYKGILPDLFREKQGAVIEGIIVDQNKIIASRVFAKHDENYMPSSIKKQLEDSSYWKKNYSSKEILDENVPKFEMNDLFNESKKLNNLDIKNKKVLINFFASWCAPCKAEHPSLLFLKNQTNLLMVGINHKDLKKNAIEFLKKEGNPYDFVGIDNLGDVSLEFGVFGLPETFIISEKEKIIYKHTGPLTEKIVKAKILPLLK